MLTLVDWFILKIWSLHRSVLWIIIAIE